MKASKQPKTILSAILGQLYSAQDDGMDYAELRMVLKVNLNSLRSAMHRLSSRDLVETHIINAARNQPNGTRFKLSPKGRAVISGVEFEPAEEDDTAPLHDAPNVARVIRFVPNSVWALGTMTPSVAG